MPDLATFLVAQDPDDLHRLVIQETEKRLSVSDLSFDHEFGVEHQYSVAYEGPPELHFVVLHPEGLPDHFHRTFRVGGCDGEHRGRCKAACRELEAEFFFRLSQEPHELGALVTVEINPDAGVSIR